MPEVKTLQVKAADPNKVGCWDYNPAHPPQGIPGERPGEVFVSGDQVFTVADTPEVRRALAEKRLVEARPGQVKQEPESRAPAETDKPGGGRADEGDRPVGGKAR